MKAIKKLFKKKPRVTKYTDEELRERLSSVEYEVAHLGKTEEPFTGEYLSTTTDGTYHCRVCDTELFSSEKKIEGGSPWPGFRAPLSEDLIARKSDFAYGIPRTETLCADCGAHLGHVFPDGQGGKDTRYCINSASLRLEPSESESAESDVAGA